MAYETLEKSLDLRDEALGDANKSIDKLNKRIAELLESNDRRLELIGDMIVNTEYCPICRYILLEGDGPHADDCRVKKEVSDEKL